MKRVIIPLLLVLSLAFNVCFALGAWKARDALRKARTPQGRAELLVEELGMNAEQRATFDAMRARLRARLALLDRKHGLKEGLDRFWAEIVREHPDRELIDSLAARGAAFRDDFEPLKIDFLVGLFGILDPDQRAELVDLSKQRLGLF